MPIIFIGKKQNIIMDKVKKKTVYNMHIMHTMVAYYYNIIIDHIL